MYLWLTYNRSFVGRHYLCDSYILNDIAVTTRYMMRLIKGKEEEKRGSILAIGIKYKHLCMKYCNIYFGGSSIKAG